MGKLATYNQINRSFKKKYIFNFGSEGGFYSEFNNMVLAIIYCLKYKYQFILYSDSSKFKVQKGWEDFFEPFCEQISSSFHSRFNKRIVAPRLRWKHYPQWLMFKLFNQNTFLTYELFHSFFNKGFEKEYFDFPELGLKGNLREVAREIVEMIYRFNEETQNEIETIISTLKLPKKYCSINVRRGDKDTEFNFAPTSAYIKKLTQLSDLTDVFVLTDDYTVIEELENSYPQLKFYALIKQEERGYIHADFIKQSSESKKNDLIKLFASVEMMRRSELVIGTFTTNPGMFLGMAMPEKKFISVQKSSWYQFETDDVVDDMVQ